MYHSVDGSGSSVSVSPAAFRAQMDYLAGMGMRSRPLARLAEWLEGVGPPLPPRSFVLTFDDGFESVASEAWPAMRRHGFTGTVFLVTSRMGGRADWSTDPVVRDFPVMSWDTARRLAGEGMDFGSHGVSHSFLTQCRSDELARELAGSRDAIQEKLGRAADLFCYPSGDYDGRVVQAVQRAGYRAAVTIFAGNRHRRDARFALRRVCGVDFEPLSYYRLATRPGYAVYIALKGENAALARQIRIRRSPS